MAEFGFLILFGGQLRDGEGCEEDVNSFHIVGYLAELMIWLMLWIRCCWALLKVVRRLLLLEVKIIAGAPPPPLLE